MASLHKTHLPYILQTLNLFDILLSKASAHAQENNLPPAEIITARLAPDMYTLAGQIRVATRVMGNFAIGVLKLDENDMGKPEDDTTFEEMHARIQAVREMFEGMGEGDFDGREEEVLVVFKPRAMPLKVALVNALIPNSFFHVTTAYGILRMKGVPLGKADFIMPYMA